MALPEQGGVLMARKPPDNDRQRRSRALDSAVRKLEAKEKRQDARSGKQGTPVRSIGRAIHRGRKDGA